MYKSVFIKNFFMHKLFMNWQDVSQVERSFNDAIPLENLLTIGLKSWP